MDAINRVPTEIRCLSSSPLPDRSIIRNNQNRQQDQAVDQVGYGCSDEFTACSYKADLRDPNISISRKSNTNYHGDGAGDLRNDNRTSGSVAPTGIDHDQTNDQANKRVTYIPIPVKIMVANQVANNVAKSANEEANNGTKEGSKE